jgi:hypothetical protein
VTELDLVVLAICQLPIDYKSFGDRTSVELVRRSRYLDHRSEVTVDRLAECLASQPDCVRAWFAWSDETRSSAHWYVRRCDVDSFEVGFLDGTGVHSVSAFDDEVRACAAYVLREVARIADLA